MVSVPGLFRLLATETPQSGSGKENQELTGLDSQKAAWLEVSFRAHVIRTGLLRLRLPRSQAGALHISSLGPTVLEWTTLGRGPPCVAPI